MENKLLLDFRESIVRLSHDDNAFNMFITALKELRSQCDSQVNSRARAGLFDEQASKDALVHLGSLNMLDTLLVNIDIAIKR